MKEVEEEVLTPVEKIERGLEYHYRYSFENKNNCVYTKQNYYK